MEASAAPGPNFDSISASVDYFLATDSGETESNSADDSEFTQSDLSFDESFSSNEGTTTSFVRQQTTLDVVGALETGANIENLHAIGRASVRAIHTGPKAGVPVADGTADMSLNFGVVDQPTPYVINVSTMATNTDSDDCSEAYVELSGVSTIYKKSRVAGGDCDPQQPTVGSASGVLPVGSYSLEAEAYAAVAADYASANSTSQYSVSLWLFPPCTHESDDTGEVIVGTGDNDVICAEGGNDEIEAGNGNDIILAGTGSDTVDAGAGNDDVFGAEGNDDMKGAGGVDLMIGDVGNDDLDAGIGDDGDFPTVSPATSGIFGGAGDDEGDGGAGRDFIDMGENNDVAFGGDGPDALAGGTGGDRLIGQGKNDLISGGDGPDVANGGGGSDDIFGQEGADKAAGGGGDDEMTGGTQDDEMDGDAGEDDLLGGPDKDDLTGGKQKDVLKGEADNDTLRAKDGVRDTVNGGPGGNDRASRDAGTDNVSGVEDFF